MVPEMAMADAKMSSRSAKRSVLKPLTTMKAWICLRAGKLEQRRHMLDPRRSPCNFRIITTSTSYLSF